MARPPASLDKLQQDVEGLMHDMQRRYLVPMQREAFLCSAKCCEPSQKLDAIQQCTDRCQRPIAAVQQALFGQLQDFQERMQRCLVRCQDSASAALPRDREPSDAQVQKAQGALLTCMDACGREFAGHVPNLRGGIEAAFKKIPKA